MSAFKKLSEIKNEIRLKSISQYWKIESQIVKRMLERELLLSDKGYDPRFKKEIEYMRKKNEIMFIPYPFVEHYSAHAIKVYYDQKEKLKYVIHKNKRLYFPLMNNEEIRSTYNQLLIEQDPDSPHRYFSETCNFEKGMVFVDVGAAEGIMSLEVAEEAEAIYLFECSENWIRALQATFRPWKEKVHIIPKYAGNRCKENQVTLDSVLKNEKAEAFFVKMDVEGMELQVLEGADYMLHHKKMKCVCTTYHQESAARTLRNYFKKQGYHVEFSKNVILFHYGFLTLINGKYRRIRRPFFRKGLIRGTNY